MQHHISRRIRRYFLTVSVKKNQKNHLFYYCVKQVYLKKQIFSKRKRKGEINNNGAEQLIFLNQKKILKDQILFVARRWGTAESKNEWMK